MTEQTDFQGRTADNKLRVAAVALKARWAGQDRQDRTGAGPSVGPDGFQDARIQVGGLSTKLTLIAIRISGPGGLELETGANPKLLATAEMIRDLKDPSNGDVYFQPTQDLGGQRLKITAVYENDQLDSTMMPAGKCDPKLRVTHPPLPNLPVVAASARWLGQDGASRRGAGGRSRHAFGAGGVAGDCGCGHEQLAARGLDLSKQRHAPAGAEPSGLPFSIKPRADRKSIDVFFPPYRDESKSTMTLRLFAADGRSAIVSFPGGACDPSKRSATPNATRATAGPGDDLQSLVDRFGAVSLSGGEYRLSRPLVLSRPVTVTAEAAATLIFSQAGTDAPWTSAIKIHCGNTTLSGFTVRFEGPIRWNNEVDYGPAVIGVTDKFDRGHDDPKFNITLTHLDLEGPAAANAAGWVEAVRLVRLNGAKSGVIEANRLRGGMIEFFDGPWRIVENDFRGTQPGMISYAVLAGHGVHDLVVRGNKTRCDGPSGKTWRFLVLTWFGADDVVAENTIEGLGSRDDDTIPWSNAPEIILTEAYHLKYEGRVIALSNDGRMLRSGASFRATGFARAMWCRSWMGRPPERGAGLCRRSIRLRI